MSAPLRNRIEIMHGVNMDALGRRDPHHYGSLTLPALEAKIDGFALELGLEAHFFQTNSEQAFVERLHALEGTADGIVINPGAWTHYAWSIHDALEIARLPAVEVHLSAVDAREEWRKVSVVRELCLASVIGEGVDGYREALVRLTAAIDR